MPTLGHTGRLHLVLQQQQCHFLPSCGRCSEGNGPGHVEAQWEVSDSSWASFPCTSPVFVWGHTEIKWWAACNLSVAGPSGLVYDLLLLRFFSPMYPFCNKNVRDFTVSKTKAIIKVPFQFECQVFSLDWRLKSQPRKRIRMNWTLKAWRDPSFFQQGKSYKWMMILKMCDFKQAT